MTSQAFYATGFALQKFSRKLTAFALGNWNLYHIDYIYSCNMCVKFRNGLQQILILWGEMED